eukprot:2285564-Rhodomonas_salina.7
MFRGGCSRHPKDQVLEDLDEVEESVVFARALLRLLLELHPDLSDVQPGSGASGGDVWGLRRARAQEPELVGLEAVGGQADVKLCT